MRRGANVDAIPPMITGNTGSYSQRNALARAPFFHRLGEIRDRSLGEVIGDGLFAPSLLSGGLTQSSGRAPRRVMSAVISRATRAPDRDVSATRHRHSRVKSSTTTRIRNRRPSVSVSDTKSRSAVTKTLLPLPKMMSDLPSPFTSAAVTESQSSIRSGFDSNSRLRRSR
jgi:hypothetical protein